MEPLTKRIFTGIGIFLFALLVANRILFFSSGTCEKIATTVTYPIFWLTSTITNHVKAISTQKIAYRDLADKYEKLKTIYFQTLEENIKLKATMRYDFLSKDLREFQERYNLNNLPLAKILVKNITDDEHFFLINKGTQNGIKKNMTALYKFQILGKVTEVFDHYAKVLLITDQTCKVAAYTSQTNAQGIIRGQNNINRCFMGYVSHLFNVVDNDMVLSSGQGLIFPEGFCLGKIVHHELKEKALYHEIEIEPLLNLDALEFCILTDQNQLKLH